MTSLNNMVFMEGSRTSTNADRFIDLGNAFAARGEWADAIENWKKAVAAAPGRANVRRALAAALSKSGQAKQAVEHMRAAIRTDPSAQNFVSLGVTLRQAEQVEAASEAFAAAIAADPGVVDGLVNYGSCLCELGRPQEALMPLDRAVELKPEYSIARFNRSIALLALGRWEQGWRDYEYRRAVPVADRPLGPPGPPWWAGEDLPGKVVLVACENGLGDTLQFIRYVPLLARIAKEVILHAQPPLRQLLGTLEGHYRIVGTDEPCPNADVRLSLLSCPAVFRTRLGDLPRRVPYLSADPSLVATWKTRLPAGGFKIGINWQGNPGYAADRRRSIPLSAFEPLASVPGVTLYSLQRRVGLEQIHPVADRVPVRVFDSPFDDQKGAAFADTAAVMASLDLVVTSDTAIAHLAGALGVRTWVAVGVGCDWRWMRDREDSPWYPTMRLFRQTRRGIWTDVFERMARALVDTLGGQVQMPSVLVPMSPGDLLDRLTILQIKSQRMNDLAKLQAVRHELQLLADVREQELPRDDALDRLVRELRHVNETLWQVEDDIRTAEQAGDFGDAFVRLARSVYRSNDHRAVVKSQINCLLGARVKEVKEFRRDWPAAKPGTA